jgi:hypothetical protein
MTAVEFAKQLKAYQAPTVDGSTVVISGKHTYATQARIVLKKMVESQGVARVATPTRPTPPRGSRGIFVQ